MTKAADQETAKIDAIVGANIRAARIQRGLSLGQFGALIGVSWHQAGKYERAINRVAASRLVIIARALNVSITDLLPGGEPVPTSVRERMALLLVRNFSLLADHDQEAVAALIARLAQGASIGQRHAA